ncbi:hypothetical protein EH138_15940 [Salmonella enterica subsp. enterica serovar Eastbourne]|uniref:Uncharacterized protein n=1 Tax=Salmonella enterica subsp. enterica serovar Eastbourne TaxID=486993 RepID=A0A702B5K8_SALET|nr:hypothetical protein [Salmonella enterica subsp. enterica serovar Eastbourne]ECA1896140.1 hypothetical protein [Salmonella enterica subsp. enterica serovar Eastbourne]HAC6674589.1 hypothetical protein [Salmonella enterica subsp. enterica serovar Eastbourne]
MEHTLKSTRRIQVGITPLIIFILDPLHVDFTVKRRSLIHRRSKPSSHAVKSPENDHVFNR